MAIKIRVVLEFRKWSKSPHSRGYLSANASDSSFGLVFHARSETSCVLNNNFQFSGSSVKPKKPSKSSMIEPFDSHFGFQEQPYSVF
jgi:hypothetical protein